MTTIKLEIKQPKPITKRLSALGWSLVIFGLSFYFVVLHFSESIANWRISWIGFSPLVILFSGLIVLLILKVVYPLESQGAVEISNTQVKISKNKDKKIIDLNQISKIELRIGGGHMTLNKSWWLLSREFFPFEHGHYNKIILKRKDGQQINSPLFLSGERQERRLRKILSELTDKQNIELKIKNN